LKANRRTLTLRHDAAEVGVGTLIVFIAMVLVAAVAAAVLISTSGELQQRAQKTGEAATQEVSSNLKVAGVYGNVSSSKIVALHIHLELAPGATPVDLTKLKIRYSDGTNAPLILDQIQFSTAAEFPHGDLFKTTWLRGSSVNSVMSAGDLVDCTIDSSAAGIGTAYQISPRKDVEVRLIPEAGTEVPADFTSPNTYGANTYVTLR
jgi:flagellin FlaB